MNDDKQWSYPEREMYREVKNLGEEVKSLLNTSGEKNRGDECLSNDESHAHGKTLL